jgi:hypothetical protein
MLAQENKSANEISKKTTHKVDDNKAFEQYASQFKAKPYPEPKGPLATDVVLGGSLPDTTPVIQNKEEEEEKPLQGKTAPAQLKEEEEKPLQGKFTNSEAGTQQKGTTPRPNNTGMPDGLKSGLENLSGYSLDEVKVHYNSDKPSQLQALAYTQGTDIHVAPGQEQHLPHEGWHVVQQMQGRVQPTMQIKEGKPYSILQMQKLGNKGIIVQRKGSTEIEISDGKLQKTGHSGMQALAESHFIKWPVFDKRFRETVKDKPIAIADQYDDEEKTEKKEKHDGKGTEKKETTYQRNRFMCAEPHALSLLLKEYEGESNKPLDNDWLDSIKFTKLAFNNTTKSNMQPCAVCKQWVADNLNIKGLKGEPFKSNAQINYHNEQLRLEQGKKEEEEAKRKEKLAKQKSKKACEDTEKIQDEVISALKQNKYADFAEILKSWTPETTKGKKTKGKKAKGKDAKDKEEMINRFIESWIKTLDPQVVKKYVDFDEGCQIEFTKWANEKKSEKKS